MSDGGCGLGEMLEQLARDDDVERRVRERELVLGVGPHGLDAQTLDGVLERGAVDVDADHRVALRIVLRQRTGPAAEVEDPQARAADERGNQPGAVVGAEDELLPLPVVCPVAPVETIKP